MGATILLASAMASAALAYGFPLYQPQIGLGISSHFADRENQGVPEALDLALVAVHPGRLIRAIDVATEALRVREQRGTEPDVTIRAYGQTGSPYQRVALPDSSNPLLRDQYALAPIAMTGKVSDEELLRARQESWSNDDFLQRLVDPYSKGVMTTPWVRFAPEGAWVSFGPLLRQSCELTLATLPTVLADRLRVAVVPVDARALVPPIRPAENAWQLPTRSVHGNSNMTAGCARGDHHRSVIHVAVTLPGGDAAALAGRISQGDVR